MSVEGRKWCLKIYENDNPECRLTYNIIRAQLGVSLNNEKCYYCFARMREIEILKNHVYVYVVFTTPRHLETVENIIPTAIVRKAYGSSEDWRHMICNVGEMDDECEKAISQIYESSFYEHGKLPFEPGQGYRSDLDETK